METPEVKGASPPGVLWLFFPSFLQHECRMALSKDGVPLKPLLRSGL